MTWRIDQGKNETHGTAPLEERNKHSYAKIPQQRPYGRGVQRILGDDIHEEVEPHDGHYHTNDWNLI